MRHDAARWVRPDCARFLIPGTRPEDIYPALARKYSRDQPRVPVGNSDGGQWTSGGSGRPRVIIDTTHWGNDGSSSSDGDSSSGTADPMGGIDFGNIGAEIDGWNLFGITSDEKKPRGVQLAGDLPDGLGGPSEEPPKIPDRKPSRSWQVTAILRSLASWSVRNSVPIETLVGAYRSANWLKDHQDVIRAARDPAKTLEELQSDLDTPKRGYDRHHIVEKTAAQRWGFSKDDTEDPANLVMIPRLKHYQITGCYATKNDRFGGLSPRDYLQDKSWSERRSVGLDALELFGILRR